MENAPYALYIAVGTLIAIIIMSLIVIRWRQIGSIESSKDTAVEIKNRAEFNAEFEAYNKNLMYGTDVLSCLNKAQNNNQKYVYNNYYGTDGEFVEKTDREEHFIDVVVKLGSEPLHEEIKAYYKDKNGNYKRVMGGGKAGNTNYKENIFGTGKNQFGIEDIYYYYFENGKLYQGIGSYTSIMNISGGSLGSIIDGGGTINTKFVGNKEYHLLTSDDDKRVSSKDETAKLSALISTVRIRNQTLNKDPHPTSYGDDDWWYCTWTTAAADFKTRKFRCTSTEYDENTGYIIKLSFEEVSYDTVNKN